MATDTSPQASIPRERRRLIATVKDVLRDLKIQLSVFSHQVGAHLELKDVDFDCLDLINRHGPLSPSEIARRAGLHPATLTGILDRLERGGWVARERHPDDRRAIVIRDLRERNAEMYRLLSPMNTAMDEICAEYTDAELDLIATFLNRTAHAGQAATEELTESRSRSD